MFYIGIDIAKHNHEASIIDSNGYLLCESISFTNSQKGCEKQAVFICAVGGGTVRYLFSFRQLYRVVCIYMLFPCVYSFCSGIFRAVSSAEMDGGQSTFFSCTGDMRYSSGPSGSD